jgi:hypothetical protein
VNTYFNLAIDINFLNRVRFENGYESSKIQKIQIKRD